MYKYLILFNFLFFAVCTPLAHAIDTIVVNGKIVTVDDRFTIVQALAIKDKRIVATGSNAEVRKLADANTRVIDVKGRTVIPGLIDNHSHWIRAAEHDELRFDGVTSRAQALQMLVARVRAAKPGEWVSVLGGWSEEQFTDDPRGFPLAELDKLAPDTPLAVQSIYNHTYLNTAGLRAAKIDDTTSNPPGGTIEKDAGGKLTGVVRGAGGVAFVAARVPKLEAEARLANAKKLVNYLNSLGVSAWGDAAWDMPPLRRVQDSGIVWGLGSDATAVTASNPFYTLGFAITGKMVGGHRVNRQGITREEALIAHTRSNAFILFQEANLGSLQKGRYADLLVLDRDYLTVPADAIKDLRPVMTMVGGKVVFERQ